jgi:quinol monooxygenase YgiN
MAETVTRETNVEMILQKMENSTAEAALATPIHQPTLRRDVVQSVDDDRSFYIVDITSNTARLKDVNSEEKFTNITRWKILFPRNDENNLRKPLHAPISIDTDPLYFLVFFFIKDEFIEKFIDMIVEEGIQVHLQESKCIRFDLWQSFEDPTMFVVLEVVQDWAGIKEHHAKDYYEKVREALWEMQARPRSHDNGYKVLLSEGYEDDMERWVSSKFRLKIPF